jgi:formylglycine-generating enzyme required for sulfatase activity
MEEDVAFCESCGANMMEGTSRSRSSVTAWPTQTQQIDATKAERLRSEQQRAKEEELHREVREREQAERQRLDRERSEAAWLREEQERAAEKERLRIAAERAAEAQRAAEAERLRLEQQQAVEAQRLRIEQEKAAEAERLRLEKAEAERLRLELEKAAQAERLRLEQEQAAAEAERLREEQHRAEEERRRTEVEQAAVAERQRLEQERAEQERIQEERLRNEEERLARAERLNADYERSAEAEKRFEETWAQADLTERSSVPVDSLGASEVTPQLDNRKVSQQGVFETRDEAVESNSISSGRDEHETTSTYLPSWTQAQEASPKSRARWVIAGIVILISITAVLVVTMMVKRQRSTAVATGPEPAKTIVPPPNMVYVAGGEFVMGADSGDEYENPAHRVMVKPFFIDAYEVTCEDYDKFLKATGHKAPPSWVNGAYAASTARKPVTGVNWDDANAYAQWAKKRLPTEEEWEFAARGSDGWKYPWGNDWKQGQANANNASPGLADVGKFEARSPLGLADMVGNAWEWTSSSIHSYNGGKIAEDQLPEDDRNRMKVIRGGCYLSNPQQATATYRRGWPPPNGPLDFNQTGFRCAFDAPSKN